MADPKPQCRTCKWYEPYQYDPEQGGKCHRYPEKKHTLQTDWCAEWTTKVKPK